MKSRRELLSLCSKKKKPSHSLISTNGSNNNTHSSSIMPKSVSTSIQSPMSVKMNNNEHQAEEESVEIKIPTPYPQSRYMLIEDPKLLNSQYTALLNEKYPPRKYLKHNLTSWMKLNRNKSKEIKFKYMNPKIQCKDYNLKKITFNQQEIGEESLTNLESANNLINTLKAKLIEYELVNNQNIEEATTFINSLKEENELYRNKLVESYEKLNYIGDKYQIDVDSINLNDSNNLVINTFRTKWLKKNFLSYLQKEIQRIKLLRVGIQRLCSIKNHVLLLKSFLSLEKNQMQNKFKCKILLQRHLKLRKKIVEMLRFNCYMNKLTKRFTSLQRTIYHMIYIKELRLNSYHKKIFTDMNKHALLHYYASLTSKSLKALRGNCFQKGFAGSIKRKTSPTDKINKINYIQFFKDLTKENPSKRLSQSIKALKVKALNSMKSLLDKIIDKEKNKFINLSIKNKPLILLHYFNLWKEGSLEFTKILQFKIISKNKQIKKFFSEAREKYFMRNYEMINNPNVRRSFCILFFQKICSNISLRKKISLFKSNMCQMYQKCFLSKLYSFVNDDPKVRLSRIKRRIEYSTFMDLVKSQIKNRSESKKIKKTVKSRREYTNSIQNQKKQLCYSFFRRIHHLLQSKSKMKNIKNLFIMKNIKMKTLHKLTLTCLFLMIKKKRHYYESVITNIKTIVEEKTEMIYKLELDNSEIVLHYENALAKMKANAEENEALRKRILSLDVKSEQDNQKFKELWNQNVNDIRNLQETLQNNEALLSHAIKREEKMQHKYCIDIQNAIKLNKHLNSIISAKNQQLLDIKLRKNKSDEDNRNEQKKLYKENASLFNDYAKIIEIKEKEKKYLEEEKSKIKDEASQLIYQIEEEKMKSEYKASLLENENKFVYDELLKEIEKKKI